MVTLTKHGYSKINDSERCLRYYFYRWKRGLTSRRFNAAPSFGTCFHAGREAYLTNGKDLQAGYRAIREAANDFLLLDGFAEQANDFVVYVADALDGYDKKWKDDKMEYISFEVKFETVIGDKPWPITGRLDGVVVFNNSVWIDECKTTGLAFSNFIRQMTMDGKTTCYVWAAQKLTGKPVQGALLDLVYKKRNQSGFDYTRDVSLRDPAVIASWEQSTIYKMRRLDEAEATGFWPQCFHSCANMYGMCPYIDLCRFGESAELINTQFLVEETETKEEGGDESGA